MFDAIFGACNVYMLFISQVITVNLNITMNMFTLSYDGCVTDCSFICECHFYLCLFS